MVGAANQVVFNSATDDTTTGNLTFDGTQLVANQIKVNDNNQVIFGTNNDMTIST